MEIRKIKENELDKLLRLYQHLHPQDEKAAPAELQKAWQTIHDHPALFHYFVIEKEDEFVASCNLSIIPNLTRGARGIGLIENVVTHSDYRQKGLGRKLIEQAIAMARSGNCYKVLLLSDAKRTDSHQFYQKLGFSGNSKKGFALRLI